MNRVGITYVRAPLFELNQGRGIYQSHGLQSFHSDTKPSRGRIFLDIVAFAAGDLFGSELSARERISNRGLPGSERAADRVELVRIGNLKLLPSRPLDSVYGFDARSDRKPGLQHDPRSVLQSAV